MFPNFKKITIKSLFSMIYALSLCSQNKAMDDHPYKEYEDLKIGINFWNVQSRKYFKKTFDPSMNDGKIRIISKNEKDNVEKFINSHKKIFKNYNIQSDIDEWKNNNNIKIYKYIVNDKVVSYAMIRILKNKIELDWLWTEPEEENKGYASDMMEFLINKADQRHLPLHLESTKKGCYLYKKFLIEKHKPECPDRIFFKGTIIPKKVSGPVRKNAEMCKKIKRSYSY